MNNVILVGFMGTGKSSVGRQLADRLHRPFIDLDHDIEAGAGRSVAQIFAEEGEAGFRERESRRLEQALQSEGVVIAAGGGAPLRDQNWLTMRDGNTVVSLTAEPAELLRRLGNGRQRPLLKPDAPTAVATLLPQRLPRYLEADLIIETDDRSASQVATEIAERLPTEGLVRVQVRIPGHEHEVIIGARLSAVLQAFIRKLAPSGPVMLVTDENLAPGHGVRLRDDLKASGLDTVLHAVPAGERAKAADVLAEIYDGLGRAGVDRQGLIVALGGGTVGDVAGFAAATWMRGVRYLQLPSTLLAMVDSSIGDKTGINHASGKNMIGAVHQPAAIFSDLDYLSTLPFEDYRASLAEVIKAAMIADGAFAAWLSESMPALLERQPSAVREAVSRAIRIKAEVVARDPSETGPRAILNYGHTVGHALERALGYGRIRHGEAVAWGMEVAARIGQLSGNCKGDVAATQHALLDAAHLLDARPLVGRSELLDALRHDKKGQGGEPRWVLLEDVGRAVFGRRIRAEVVDQALSEVLGL